VQLNNTPDNGAVRVFLSTIISMSPIAAVYICCSATARVADVESEGPSRAAGGGLVDRLPVRGLL
jgi:hypothetical protein